jgi:NAD(P)-dependent dehydrogenase (short-subunit alcohol dehydrogenase family)
VNDTGGALNGSGSSNAAQAVADEIRKAGGEAVADTHSVASFEGADAIVKTAVDKFGGVDILVNNAGILRDRMFVNTTAEEWDAVIRVHLRGHFCVGRHAAAYWRDQSKAGAAVDARLINTSSGAGLMGSVAQTAYAAAKAGIAAMTVVTAVELARYGVTVNGLAPSARTRLTEGVFVDMMKEVEPGQFDAMDPDNISPIVVWLGSRESKDVTGRMFEIEGGSLSVCDGWQHGAPITKDRRWEPAEIGPAVREMIANGPAPAPVYGVTT